MTKIRTHNRRRQIARRRKVLIAAREYHRERCLRLEASGNIHKIRNSSWIKRQGWRA